MICFLITPCDPNWCIENTGQAAYNYSFTYNCINFLDDITSCIVSDSMVDITLTFKPKRIDVSNRDSIYINYLSQLQLEQKVELVEADINLYTLISSADLTNVPFSCLPDNIEFIQHSDQLKFELRQTLLTAATSAYTS